MPDLKEFASALSAKIWECMRRDDQFCDTLKELRSGKPSPAASNAFRGALFDNRFAGFALGTALVPAPHDIEAIKDHLEDLEWPNLPLELRSGFEHIAQQLAPLPRLVPSPPVASDETRDVNGKDHTPQLLRAWLANAPLIFGNWQVLAVPKVVLSDRHRRLIMGELDKVIGETKRSWVKFKPGGSVLGSAVDWDVYLFIEELELSGVSRTMAMNQAAWKFYERDDYVAHGGDRLSSLGKRLAKAAYNRHGGHIQARYSAVKDAIKSVYPAFKLFSMQ